MILFCYNLEKYLQNTLTIREEIGVEDVNGTLIKRTQICFTSPLVLCYTDVPL